MASVMLPATNSRVTPDNDAGEDAMPSRVGRQSLWRQGKSAIVRAESLRESEADVGSRECTGKLQHN